MGLQRILFGASFAQLNIFEIHLCCCKRHNLKVIVFSYKSIICILVWVFGPLLKQNLHFKT